MLSVSPNGDWIAYQSSDSGQYGVYIERFPELGSRRVVSNERGGWGPVWSHDGSELYCRRLGDGAMMAVRIDTSPALRIGTPEMLFESRGYLPVVTPQAGTGAGRSWDVAPDGRLLMVKANAVSGSNEIVVVEHWLDELNRLAPEK